MVFGHRETNETQENNFLTPENISFDKRKNTLLLNVDKKIMDLSSLQELANKNGFDQKREFHITVLGFKNGGEIKRALKPLSPTERQEKLTEIESLVDSMDWGFVLEPQQYHISKEYISPAPKNKDIELKERRGIWTPNLGHKFK